MKWFDSTEQKTDKQVCTVSGDFNQSAKVSIVEVYRYRLNSKMSLSMH